MVGDHPLHHPAAISYKTPETEPWVFGFWDFGPTPPPGFALVNVQPPCCLCVINCTHHILASSYAAVSHGTPETEPRALSFWDFGPSPAPGFALANVQPPRCRHVIYPYPPPPSITLPCRCVKDRRLSQVFGHVWFLSIQSRWHVDSFAHSLHDSHLI